MTFAQHGRLRTRPGKPESLQKVKKESTHSKTNTRFARLVSSNSSRNRAGEPAQAAAVQARPVLSRRSRFSGLTMGFLWTTILMSFLNADSKKVIMNPKLHRPFPHPDANVYDLRSRDRPMFTRIILPLRHIPAPSFSTQTRTYTERERETASLTETRNSRRPPVHPQPDPPPRSRRPAGPHPHGQRVAGD